MPLIRIGKIQLFLVWSDSLKYSGSKSFAPLINSDMRDFDVVNEPKMLANLSQSRMVKEIKSKSSEDKMKRVSHAFHGKLFQVNLIGRSRWNLH